MKHCLFLAFLLIPPVVTQGQTKPPKSALPQSHRVQLLSRLNLAEAQFKVSCAKTADHAENKQCSSEMLRDLQQTWGGLSLAEIPVPKAVSRNRTVLVFKEDVLMGDDEVTLVVYETENNDELYSDSRSRLILSNDLTKLLAGYVKTLDEQ